MRSAPTNVPAGWQVVLADLSLILFIATAAALSGQTWGREDRGHTVPEPAVFSAMASGGDDMAGWLARYPSDPRERLRITIRYRADDFAHALERAQTARDIATGAGQRPLILLEQHSANATVTAFAFDGEQAGLAHALQ